MISIFLNHLSSYKTFRCEESTWNITFQALGSFETLGSKLIEHGLRIVSKAQNTLVLNPRHSSWLNSSLTF